MLLALVLVAFGLGLRLAVVRTPFFLDDLAQLTCLSEDGSNWFSFRGSLDLFRFFDGDRESALAKMSAGEIPWRFDDNQLLAYFRPLSSASMWLDHALFGLKSLPAHLLSFAWFALFVFVIWRLYGHFLPPGARDLATLATLLSPVTIITVKWWVGRYAILVGTFAAGGILFHLRWLKNGRRSHRLLSLGCLALSLFAGEIGIQGLAFIIAHTIVRLRTSVGKIVRELWPILLFLAAYMIVRTPLGYGVENSALYIDPIKETPAFLVHAASNLHTLLVGAVLNQVREGYIPPLPTWKLIFFVGLLLFIFVPVVRKLVKSRERATLTLFSWLTCAAALTLVFCFTSRRELRPWTFIIPQIATHALLALGVTSAWRRWGKSVTPHDALLRVAAGVLVAIWIVLPLESHFMAIKASRTLQRNSSPYAMRARFPAEVRRAITEDTTLIVFLRSPDHVLPRMYLELWCDLDMGPDLTTLTLSDNALVPLDDLVLTRTGIDSLRLHSSEPFVRANDMYRYTERFPLRTGQRIVLSSMTVTVEEVAPWQGKPGTTTLQRLRSALFTFEQALESESTLLLTWSRDHFELVTPPPIGQSIRLR